MVRKEIVEIWICDGNHKHTSQFLAERCEKNKALKKSRKERPAQRASEKKQRNANIIYMHASGQSFAALARTHELSVTRVRQIVANNDRDLRMIDFYKDYPVSDQPPGYFFVLKRQRLLTETQHASR